MHENFTCYEVLSIIAFHSFKFFFLYAKKVFNYNMIKMFYEIFSFIFEIFDLSVIWLSI